MCSKINLISALIKPIGSLHDKNSEQTVVSDHAYFMAKMAAFAPLSRLFSAANVKDEPPDSWDEGVQQQEESERDDKEKVRVRDRDLEFLFQDVVRDSSLDEWLKNDLQSKKSDRKYKEMLVRTIFPEVDLHYYVNLLLSALIVPIKG